MQPRLPLDAVSLEVIAEQLATPAMDFAEQLDGPVHFVTHSMGGLIIRILLSRHRPRNLGRVVMLAPPNHGSEIADRIQHFDFLRRALGPAASQIVTRPKDVLPKLLGEADYELGIIAGNRAFDPIGAILLPRPHDGRVSVASTKDPCAADHIIVPTAHTTIIWNRLVMCQTLAFLATGRFDHSAKR